MQDQLVAMSIELADLRTESEQRGAAAAAELAAVRAELDASRAELLGAKFELSEARRLADAQAAAVADAQQLVVIAAQAGEKDKQAQVGVAGTGGLLLSASFLVACACASLLPRAVCIRHHPINLPALQLKSPSLLTPPASPPSFCPAGPPGGGARSPEGRQPQRGGHSSCSGGHVQAAGRAAGAGKRNSRWAGRLGA